MQFASSGHEIQVCILVPREYEPSTQTSHIPFALTSPSTQSQKLAMSVSVDTILSLSISELVISFVISGQSTINPLFLLPGSPIKLMFSNVT